MQICESIQDKHLHSPTLFQKTVLNLEKTCVVFKQHIFKNLFFFAENAYFLNQIDEKS